MFKLIWVLKTTRQSNWINKEAVRDYLNKKLKDNKWIGNNMSLDEDFIFPVDQIKCIYIKRDQS